MERRFKMIFGTWLIVIASFCGALEASSTEMIIENRLKKVERNKSLLKAATKGNVGEIKRLLEDGANVNYDEFRVSPLLAAVENSHLDAAKLLITQEADVN